MGRKIRDETEAMACLAAVARSSLSRREWARAHGIDGRSLNSWRLNLERRGRSAEMTALRLVEVFAGETAARDHNASTPIVLHAVSTHSDRVTLTAGRVTSLPGGGHATVRRLVVGHPG